MLRNIIVCLLVVCTLLACGCAGNETIDLGYSNIKSTAEKPEGSHVVRLDKSTIELAVAECQSKTTWGINLAEVRINYVKGVTVVGALVLHNGNDAERLINIKYRPVTKELKEKATGTIYSPSPIHAEGWVSIDTQIIRLERMQTHVVEVRLTVPKDADIKASYWQFQIAVEGEQINSYQQEAIVTTVEGDTTLVIKLHNPLLQDSIEYVTGITSTLEGELPYILGYDPETMTLNIGGLMESQLRNITISYEYPSMVVVGYNQRWLITML